MNKNKLLDRINKEQFKNKNDSNNPYVNNKEIINKDLEIDKKNSSLPVYLQKNT